MWKVNWKWLRFNSNVSQYWRDSNIDNFLFDYRLIVLCENNS